MKEHEAKYMNKKIPCLSSPIALKRKNTQIKNDARILKKEAISNNQQQFFWWRGGGCS